ncbi:MAG: Uma2 family endonuclease [Gemmataceae bacterium]|nr:Uma2 family endonuclease [Gemmataceae bacterium]
MSLKAFEFADTVAGYHYELSRGYITVSEVANYLHALVVAAIRDVLSAYKTTHPGRIHLILSSMECKLLMPAWESERHPDLAAYFTKPKGPKNRALWRTWIPEFVIEVVSERSADRDYIEKRVEYWTLGVKEYWIVDPKREQVLLLTRGKSDWSEKRVGPGGNCTTKLLPGFKLPYQVIADAVAEAEDDTEGF